MCPLTPKISRHGLACVAMAGFGAAVTRAFLFDFESGDYLDFLSGWYDHFLEKGRWQGLGDLDAKHFSYPSLYMTLMSLITWLPLPKLYAIKALSTVFDFIGALLMYRIVLGFGGSEARALTAAATLLCLPTVVVNASLWGQCDMMYTVCFLWSFLALIRNRSAQCLIACGFAAALKPQAVFWAPFLAGLFIAGKLSWRFLGLTPAMYAVCGFPEILAGRPWGEVLLHWGEVDTAPRLTFNAANWYQWVPNEPFAVLWWCGVGATLVWTGLFVLRIFTLREELTWPRRLVSLALFTLLFPPFLLPWMHERYYFPADVFSLLYAFCTPRGWLVAATIQGISAFSYLPFLFNLNPVPLGVLAVFSYGVLCLVAWGVWQPVKQQDCTGFLPTVADEGRNETRV